jgi:catechol 2,3-dioxygenase-like lactoylglutathione lyase family enzyme
MLNLPQPMLGEISALTITTPDLEMSLTFYKKLGFSELFRADWPFPWIQITDGALLIMLRKDDKPYIALTYYVNDVDKVVAMLDEKGIDFAQRAKDTDALKRYLIKSPDGLNISLVGMPTGAGFKQPPGPTMLNMPQQDFFNPDKYVNKVCGLFGEFAYPVADLEKAIAFWQQLGFTAVSKFSSPYPWAILSDGLSIIGAHQAVHDLTLEAAFVAAHYEQAITLPAITFFAADMKDKIKKLKAEGLTDYTDKGESNTVLKTPEQQTINLFKLGM